MDWNEIVMYEKIFKNPWSYTVGAILLALINISMFFTTGKPWGVTTPFSYWGAWIYQAIGGDVNSWYYFAATSHGNNIAKGLLYNGSSFSDFGIIFGALLATLLASQFKIKKIKSKRQALAAIVGGLLMGYGARIAFGCNIGALFSGTASMSLHGWIFMIFLFVGAFVGGKILVKYLL